MSDDGEPQTVVYEEQLVTTWRNVEGRWWVRVESKDLRAAGATRGEERLMDPGHERLDAYEIAVSWIDSRMSNSL